MAEIGHYVYVGDTALHVAAAGYGARAARALVDAGADVAARNRRGAAPLHYAADGIPGTPGWSPAAQAETVVVLLEAGADPDATDNSGVTALHRAVRTRCAAAVAALLDGGADPDRPNRNGSTPSARHPPDRPRRQRLAEARAQQREIIRLLATCLGTLPQLPHERQRLERPTRGGPSPKRQWPMISIYARLGTCSSE